MRTYQIAIRFFKAHEETILLAFGFELIDLIANILEARKHAAHFKTTSTRQSIGHRRRNDSRNRYFLIELLATLFCH